MTLWTASEAARATAGQAQGDWRANGVSIDTRTLQPGDLFVALKAARDGHDFVAQALEKGAAAALVTHVPDGVAPDAPLLIVPDVQLALEALGQAARARTGARVVAVTGSAGKTSTKEMLICMLRGQGRTHASVASYNNHWGVPLTLARMPRDAEFAIIEIGMNHPGEIAPLARMAAAHVAMVTTVAPAHLEAFDSVEDIAREKASVFDGLTAGGTAVLNRDLPVSDILREHAGDRAEEVVEFGQSQGAWRLTEVSLQGDQTRARATTPFGDFDLSINSLGQHFALNALAALAACAALGADPARSAASLTDWVPYQGRGALETLGLPGGGTLVLLDDSYNANPASMAAALDVLAAVPAGQGRRVAILGDMKELGPEAEALHAALSDHPAMQAIDEVHCIGPLMQALYAALPARQRGLQVADSATLAQQLPERLKSGDIVLAKGSLSMNLALIVDAIHKMGQGGPVQSPQDNE